jgi:hypothetical protein
MNHRFLAGVFVYHAIHLANREIIRRKANK